MAGSVTLAAVFLALAESTAWVAVFLVLAGSVVVMAEQARKMSQQLGSCRPMIEENGT